MLFHPFHQTIIFESNTRIFCREKGIKIGKELAKIYLDMPELKSSHYLWAMGIWKKSKLSQEIARSHAGLQTEYHNVLPHFHPDDVIGSPYAVYDYIPEPSLCESWENLDEFRETLNDAGVKLILDFVPNHMARDTVWLDKAPGVFLKSNNLDKNSFLYSDNAIYAMGRDPFFDGWTDTVQFDFSESETLDLHVSFIQEISRHCDGLRCDMAMLPLSDIFERTHGKKGLPMYWEEMIGKTKNLHPDFLFLAEVYWHKEALLQNKGFDLTYDKDLYDHLLHKNTQSVIYHLQADTNYLSSSLQFLENHDEKRASAVFFRDSVPFFSLMANMGGGLLLHEGQTHGYKKKIPVQLGKYPPDTKDYYLEDFYDRILPALRFRKDKSAEYLDKLPNVYGEDCYVFVRFLIWEKSRREICIYNPHNKVVSGRILLNREELKIIFPENNISLYDFTTGHTYVQDWDEVEKEGIYFSLDAWHSHWFLLL